MTAPMPGAVMGRPTNTRLAEQLTEAQIAAEDLRMELEAIHAERHQLGLELGWLSRLLHRAVLQERDDLALEASGRLDHISGRLIRQGGAS